MDSNNDNNGRDYLKYEDPLKRARRIMGIIAAVVFGAVFFIGSGREGMPLADRIPFSIAFAWMGYNMGTDRGRTRPKIVHALRISYPVILLALFYIMVLKR